MGTAGGEPDGLGLEVGMGQYAVLKAMAEAQDKPLSALVRETVEWALDRERQARRLRELFARAAEETEA